MFCMFIKIAFFASRLTQNSKESTHLELHTMSAPPIATSSTPRYMAPLQRQRDAYVNPHVHADAQLRDKRVNDGVTPLSSGGGNGVVVRKLATSGVVVPSRTFPADSAEARLLSLMQHHQQTHGASLWPARLDALQQHVLRVQFLDAPQEQFLRLVVERSKRYLRNVEDMMTDAAADLVAVDGGVLRTISSSWDAAKALVARAEHILDEGYANKWINAPSSGAAEGRRGTPTTRGGARHHAIISTMPTLQAIQLPHRQPAVAAASTRQHGRVGSSNSTPTRAATPDGRRSPLTSPSAHHGVDGQPQRHRAGEVPAQRNSHVALSARKDLLETIEAIGFGCLVAAELTADAMAEAKQCFLLLYGTADGHRRFLKWCDEQTLHLSRCQSF